MQHLIDGKVCGQDQKRQQEERHDPQRTRQPRKRAVDVADLLDKNEAADQLTVGAEIQRTRGADRVVGFRDAEIAQLEFLAGEHAVVNLADIRAVLIVFDVGVVIIGSVLAFREQHDIGGLVGIGNRIEILQKGRARKRLIRGIRKQFLRAVGRFIQLFPFQMHIRPPAEIGICRKQQHNTDQHQNNADQERSAKDFALAFHSYGLSSSNL